MSLFSDTDGSETTQCGLHTPNTEFEERTSIRVWLELQEAVRCNHMHDPTPGDTIIIIDKTYERILSCHPRGHVILDNINEYDMHQPIPQRWKWLYTETDGFIGFRSLAEDKFLGHDSRWNFDARATTQRGHQNFILIKRQNGYRIQNPYWFGVKPLVNYQRALMGLELKQSNPTVHCGDSCKSESHHNFNDRGRDYKRCFQH